ncbi:Dabb family protein [Catenuloplanes japonicus]|uniref:Dabb family protein n=1 Tax=Catenuloplanes japonicus TaxID=33876 RepID=UPI0005271B49|nr:Dabb family protein [Catenuloplanes japonicus]
MIYHSIRMKARDGVTRAQIEEALECLREQGRVIPAVRSFVVGRDFGGDFDWTGVFVIEDLDGYWEYLVHPAHLRTDRVGLPLLERFMQFDVTDDEDPDFGARIAELHRRRYEEDPELAALVAGLLPR